jgi:hypothetical protein
MNFSGPLHVSTGPLSEHATSDGGSGPEACPARETDDSVAGFYMLPYCTTLTFSVLILPQK